METLLHTILAEKARLYDDQDGADGKRGRVYCVAPEASAADAIRLMCEANVGCLLVMEDGKLAGVMSERDVLRKIADRGLTADQVSVREIMNPRVFTVKPGMTVEQALIHCTDRRIRHLPVWENGELLGLLSIGDLVSFVVRDKDRTIADLIDYIHGPQIQI